MAATATERMCFLKTFLAIALIVVPMHAFADETPIAGTVTAVDAGAQTLLVEARAKGKTREVVIHVRPTTKIVRFVRDGTGPIKEQTARLDDLKPGWTVSVTTKHEGDNEVAEIVRVIHEK
jgi:hypothetical protein